MSHKLINNGKFIIRNARVEDSKNIISYIRKVVIESDNLTFEDGEFNPSVDSEKQYIESIDKSSNECFFILLNGTEIIGNLSINTINRNRLKHSGNLSITVLKEYWNQGVATKLMIKFIQWLKTTELTKINLKVREDNIYAIKLYEKFGFTKEGLITRDFYIDGQYYNSLCMGMIIN